MGQLSHDPFIQHFSHPHRLELTNTQALNTITPSPLSSCSGCKIQSSGWMYTCSPCNFTLHVSCTQLPHLIKHPSHPSHPLSLLPTPLYPGGIFTCDACGRRGHGGFSYHCSHCDFDIHTFCASKPLLVAHQSHPHHLNLIFHPPYQTKGFSCDICRRIGSNHWLYRCGGCDFDAHLDCATKAPTPLVQPQMHHQNSNYVQNYQHQYHSSGTSTTNIGPGNALMGAVVQGFAEGAAQEVGQNFVQSIMSDGSGGGGGSSGGAGDGGGGGDNCDMSGGGSGSSTIITMGSSILSGLFSD